MFQPRKDNLFTSLLDLSRQPSPKLAASQIHRRSRQASKKHVWRTYLVKIKHQIQLAYIPKERIQHLHEEM